MRSHHIAGFSRFWNGYDGETNELGQPHGQGTMTYAVGPLFEFDDEDYDGEHPLLIGDAVLRFTGEFEDGEANGLGIQYYSDGGRYEGKFKDNKANGLGVMYRPDGSVRFKFVYKDDEVNGPGVMYRPDGSVIFECEFKDGRPL